MEDTRCQGERCNEIEVLDKLCNERKQKTDNTEPTPAANEAWVRTMPGLPETAGSAAHVARATVDGRVPVKTLSAERSQASEAVERGLT